MITKQNWGIFILLLFLTSKSYSQENLGFEFLDFTNWEMYTGNNYNYPTTMETTYGVDHPSKRHNINTINYTDPYTFNSLNIIPEGELFSVRLGNDNVNKKTERLRYSFQVDESNNNGFLYYKYAVVFQNPDSHDNTQPKLIINTYVNGAYQNCESYQVDANVNVGAATGFNNGENLVKWKDWTTVGLDLSEYSVGDVIQLEFVNYDCGEGAHFGYTYIAAGFKDEVISHEACADDGRYYLFAPEGFSYLWNTGETTQYIAINNAIPGTNYSCQLTLNIGESDCDHYTANTKIKDYDCCTWDEGEGPIDITDQGVAGNIGYSTSIPNIIINQHLYINGTFYVNDYLVLKECTVDFGPNGKIVVLPNNVFTDKGNSVFKPCNNTFLWDGIYDSPCPEVISPLLSFVKSSFYSAKSAINTEQLTPLNIFWGEFYNCHTAIELKDYELDINDNPTDNFIYTRSKIYGGELNEEHESSNHSVYGVKIFNSKDLVLGRSLTGTDYNNPCIYDNLKVGVFNHNSVFHIINSNFVNPQPASYGILSQSLSSSTNEDCGVNVEECNFIRYSTGIKQHGPTTQHTNVWRSTFKGNKVGIQSTCLGDYFINKGSKIRRNIFDDTTYGINISGFNDDGALNIYANKFLNTKRKSIWIKNIHSYFPYPEVQDMLEGVCVVNNWITYDQPIHSINVIGISLNNCQGSSGPQVHKNRLTYYAKPSEEHSDKYRAIEVKDVIRGYVDKNEIVSWGEGIRVAGHDELLKFRCNDFLDCYKGFRFTGDILSSESYISQQGSINRPHNNYFYGDIDERFSGKLSNESDVFWWSNPGFLTELLFSNYTLQTQIEDYYTTATTNCNSSEPTPSLGILTPDDDGNSADSEVYDPIANDDLPSVVTSELLDYEDPYINTEDSDATMYRNKYLYSLVELQPNSLASGDLEFLTNLYNVLIGSNIAKMVKVDKYISNGDFNLAIEKNNEIISNNLTQIVSKEVYNIWLQTWAEDIYEFTQEQEDVLLDYALLTPYYGGEAVYLARIMLDLDIDDYEIDYRQAQEQEQEQEFFDVENDWLVYYDNSHINVEGEQTASELVLYDISGREVFKVIQEFPKGGKSVVALPTLAQGVYIIKLLDSNANLLYSDKVVIH